MKRAYVYFACIWFLSLLAAPYRAIAFVGVEAGVGYWRESASGSLQYGTPGDVLNVENDLHLENSGQVLARLKIELPLGLPNIYVMATPVSFSGNAQTTRAITYDSVTFSANSPISSTFKLDQYDLALYYPIPLLKTATLGILNAELGLDGRQLKFEGAITGSVSGVTETSSKSATYYIPMLYAAVQVKPILACSIEAEFRGSTYESNGFYDYIGRLKVTPYGPLFISGGYRSEQVKINEDDLRTNLRISGPFIEAGVSF